MTEGAGPSRTPGPALRANWDATCDRALALVEAARLGATGYLATYLDRQRSAVGAIKAEVDGRRRIPDPGLGIGILHDSPADLEAPEYAETLNALRAVQDLWIAQLNADGWDWANGYPPDWPDRLVDRLRAGLVYRKK